MPPPSARERFGRQQSCFLRFELADARRRDGKRDFRNRFIEWWVVGGWVDEVKVKDAGGVVSSVSKSASPKANRQRKYVKRRSSDAFSLALKSCRR